MNAPLRLGFPVKVMTRPDLKSNDTRRWQKNPHLRTSLEYVDAILDHLDRRDIRHRRRAMLSERLCQQQQAHAADSLRSFDALGLGQILTIVIAVLVAALLVYLVAGNARTRRRLRL